MHAPGSSTMVICRSVLTAKKSSPIPTTIKSLSYFSTSITSSASTTLTAIEQGMRRCAASPRLCSRQFERLMSAHVTEAERLRQAIASSPVSRSEQVTASIGVATYPSGAKNKEELIEMADRAMYLAKAAGRNRVRTLAHRSYSGVDVS